MKKIILFLIINLFSTKYNKKASEFSNFRKLQGIFLIFVSAEELSRAAHSDTELHLQLRSL